MAVDMKSILRKENEVITEEGRAEDGVRGSPDDMA